MPRFYDQDAIPMPDELPIIVIDVGREDSVTCPNCGSILPMPSYRIRRHECPTGRKGLLQGFLE